MFIRKPLVCVLAFAAAFALAGCGNHQGASTSSSPVSSVVATASHIDKLVVTNWGPQSTKAGEVFNVQPRGNAAMWLQLNHSIGGDEVAVDFNGTLLPAVVQGNLVTVAVPAKLYAVPGSFRVHIVARKSEQSERSNDVTFTVK